MSRPASGSRPPGIDDGAEAARWIRRMFASVASRYDLLNHLLSFNFDRRWRSQAVERVRPVLERSGARVVDLCCGTGDLTAELSRRGRAMVAGCDFCLPMLIEARRKLSAARLPVRLIEADVLVLPLASESVDLVTIAFGLRNLADYQAGLKEMVRVLKSGGLAAVLEFSRPPAPWLAAAYGFYSRKVIPTIGAIVSGNREAYAYLPDSVRRFPGPEELAAAMRQAGFSEVSYELLTGGIVALHLGRR